MRPFGSESAGPIKVPVYSSGKWQPVPKGIDFSLGKTKQTKKNVETWMCLSFTRRDADRLRCPRAKRTNTHPKNHLWHLCYTTLSSFFLPHPAPAGENCKHSTNNVPRLTTFTSTTSVDRCWLLWDAGNVMQILMKPIPFWQSMIKCETLQRSNTGDWEKVLHEITTVCR